MIFVGKPASTFPDHALALSAAADSHWARQGDI